MEGCYNSSFLHTHHSSVSLPAEREELPSKLQEFFPFLPDSRGFQSHPSAAQGKHRIGRRLTQHCYCCAFCLFVCLFFSPWHQDLLVLELSSHDPKYSFENLSSINFKSTLEKTFTCALYVFEIVFKVIDFFSKLVHQMSYVSQTSVYELPGCQFNDPHLLHHQQRPMRHTDTKECNSLPASQCFSLGPLCLNAGLDCQLPSCHAGHNVPQADSMGILCTGRNGHEAMMRPPTLKFVAKTV